ncbi:hypothetical protein TYRP_008917 [Tyrophagus putrescentiae]|nr:hypothetical protein TYRP_008917 [Tyrophagus putrescentiae]
MVVEFEGGLNPSDTGWGSVRALRLSTVAVHTKSASSSASEQTPAGCRRENLSSRSRGSSRRREIRLEKVKLKGLTESTEEEEEERDRPWRRRPPPGPPREAERFHHSPSLFAAAFASLASLYHCSTAKSSLQNSLHQVVHIAVGHRLRSSPAEDGQEDGAVGQSAGQQQRRREGAQAGQVAELPKDLLAVGGGGGHGGEPLFGDKAIKV